MSRTPLDLARRVDGWARRAWPERAEAEVLAPAAGGHSGLTFLATPPGDDHPAFVVKAAPEGVPPIGRHDVVRQAELMTAVRINGFPAPAVLHVDAEAPPWMAMAWVDGDIHEPVFDGTPLDGAALEARLVAAVEALATLHRPIPASISVDEEPQGPAEELERWARLMAAVPAGGRPGSVELEGWLRGHVPAGLRPAVLHGDYRLGNMAFLGDRVVGVIDWEIWSVGDPRVDLAYFLLFCDAGHFPGIGAPVAAPDRSVLVARYEAGRGGELEDLAWFDALARFKLAAIMGHNVRRHLEGRHEDPVAEQLVPSVGALLAAGLEAVS